MREIFPNLTQLDGKELPPIVTFDIKEDEKKLPETLLLYSPNDEVKTVVTTFLAEYFKIYDSDNRQDLLYAYHQDAVFTFSYFYDSGGAARKFIELDEHYKSNARNLTKIKSHLIKSGERRLVDSKNGRLDVVACLDKFPKTEHDLNSFKLDVIHSQSTSASTTASSTAPTHHVIVFSIAGIYLDRDCKTPNRHRAFYRTFVLVPFNQGLVVSNDDLVICPVSDSVVSDVIASKEVAAENTRRSLTIGGGTSSSSSSLTAGAVSTTSADSSTTAAALSGDVNVQNAMISSFAAQSTMNIEWAKRCLMENNWDYNLAALNFSDLQTKGKIPPEAFVKLQ